MNRGLPFAALLLAALVCASCAKQQEGPRLTRVVVTGQSDVKAQPDTAVVVLSVVTQGPRALEVQRENARKTEAVIAAVRGAAGPPPEVKTSDYSLQPQRDWGYNGVPKIRGYEARNRVSVTTGALDSVGALIDAASQAGANSVDGVSFVLRESNPARRETLAEATREARAKAESIANALGGRVVRVVEQQEGGAHFRPYATLEEEERQRVYAATMANMAMSGAGKPSPRTPVEEGPLNVRSQVQLVVEIEVTPQAVAAVASKP
ncbi:MAG TPA: SIMPL domain-containing protein [Pyrinomonadaceae bacterium]|nr:SIMPL domain-containing protein [Pyrinomonadaceae bacterium]